jgi:hypothetical protein
MFLGAPETGATLYIGSPLSRMQCVIYDKRDDVVRIECRLGRETLKRKKIRKPAELLKLRSSFELRELVCFRDVSESGLEQATKSWSTEGKAMARDFAFRRLRSQLVLFLRANNVPLESVLPLSKTHERVQAMIWRLYW